MHHRLPGRATRALQFLQRASHVARDASDGSWIDKPRLDDSGTAGNTGTRWRAVLRSVRLPSLWSEPCETSGSADCLFWTSEERAHSQCEHRILQSMGMREYALVRAGLFELLLQSVNRPRS